MTQYATKAYPEVTHVSLEKTTTSNFADNSTDNVEFDATVDIVSIQGSMVVGNTFKVKRKIDGGSTAIVNGLDVPDTKSEFYSNESFVLEEGDEIVSISTGTGTKKIDIYAQRRKP